MALTLQVMMNMTLTAGRSRCATHSPTNADNVSHNVPQYGFAGKPVLRLSILQHCMHVSLDMASW